MYEIYNNVIPKYYAEFRKKVLSGEIPVCETISMEMNRIDALVKDPNIYYNPKAVEGWISFCENELTLTDGSPLKLLDSFKLWAEQVYAWWYWVERRVYEPGVNGKQGHYVKKRFLKRLTKKQILIIPRGGAKSMYDSCHQQHALTIVPQTTHQITTAPTMRQAEEVMSPIRTAILRARGPWYKFLTEGSVQSTSNKVLRQKLVSTKKGIENFMNGSLLEVLPMTIDKLQGYRPFLSTVDEWLSGNIREDVIGAIEQGASKLEDYLIIASSSEGTIRNGAGDTIKMEVMSILRGEYEAKHVSIWYYRLDSIEEVGYPELWVKAQPNLDYTISYEAYQLDIERMEQVPSSRNDILAKRFGIPMEGFTYYFTYDETLPMKNRKGYWQLPCSLGMDLSQGDDFCSFTFLFPLNNDCFGIETLCYITEYTLLKLPQALREKYETFIEEGSLRIFDGTVLDMDLVYEDLEKYIDEREYDVVCVGYDPYGATEFIKRWKQERGEYGVEKVIQGSRTETIPLGEIKNLSEQSKLYFSQNLFSFTMGNCVVQEDSNGNRKLWKKRREQKIDAVAALLDAYVSYKYNKSLFE